VVLRGKFGNEAPKSCRIASRVSVALDFAPPDLVEFSSGALPGFNPAAHPVAVWR